MIADREAASQGGNPNGEDWPGSSVLAVCAHPDDESFGLGAVLADAAARGASVSLLCFTHGEASTLSEQSGPLGEVRNRELRAAASVLGLRETVLLDYPDGSLSDTSLDDLADHVEVLARRAGANALLAFDLGGVTGHPDHHRATEAALRAADRMNLPVTGWAVPYSVASTLNAELGTRFLGRYPDETATVLRVDRSLQLQAIACHISQSGENPVLWRRLELQGRREYLVSLRRPIEAGVPATPPSNVATRRSGPAIDPQHEVLHSEAGGADIQPPWDEEGWAYPGRSLSVPLRTVFAVAVVAALVGATAALGVARISGWGRQTVVNRYIEPNTSTINSRPANIPSILAKVLPGVVSIEATSSVSSPFFGTGGGSTTAVTATGTGVIVTAGGEVVTNDHVVSGATSITVTLNDSATPLAATLVGASAPNDLALLQIKGAQHLDPVTFGDSSKIVVGDDVLAVGYALGLSGGPTVTEGIISAKGRQVSTETVTGASVTLRDMIQTDAAISSGNSGGPLVDSAAEVVGINTVVAASSGSTTAQNIGFAITSQTVETLLSQLRSR